jgi:hypothetical protein
MSQRKTLVKDQSMGNVIKCSCGLIHVNTKGVSLHFTENSFLRFSRMMQKAGSELMDEGLKNLLKGNSE